MVTENPKAPETHLELADEMPAATGTMTKQMDKELQQNLREEAGKSGTTEHPPAAHNEHGGQAGPEPTRYGDWEKNGRCTDF